MYVKELNEHRKFNIELNWKEMHDLEAYLARTAQTATHDQAIAYELAAKLRERIW